MPLTKVKKDVIQNLNANKVTGTFGANDGSALLGVAAIDHQLRYNLSQNFFNDSVKDSLNRYALDQGWVDTFEDTDDVDGEGVSVPMTKFDGVNDYLNHPGSLGGSDSDKVAMSFWIKPKNDGTGRYILAQSLVGTGHVFYLVLNSANKLFMVGLGTGAAGRIQTIGTTTLTEGNLYHVLVDIDLGNSIAQFYINDVADVMNDTTKTTGDILFSGDWKVGDLASTVTNDKMDGSLGALWFNSGTRIDFSQPVNRRLFIDANGKPVDLGPNGEKPLGTAPHIYLNNPYGSFQTNLGTGGNFSVTGEPVDGGYANGKTYSSKSFSNSYELIDSYGKENAASQPSNLRTDSRSGSGQAITLSTGKKLITAVAFLLKKTGAPTGNMYANIYTTTGTVGTNGKPDGNIIAQSNPLLMGDLTTSYAVTKFTFPEPVLLMGSTDYCFELFVTGGDISNNVQMDSDDTSPTHGGNWFLQTAGNIGDWNVADNTRDMIFYLYGTKNLDLITKGSDDIGNSPSAAPEKGHMEVLLTERPAGGTSTWSDVVTTDDTVYSNETIRQVIGGSNITISAGGNRCRFTLNAHSTVNFGIDNLAIVERSGETPHGVTTPTEILFGGASGCLIPAGGSIVTDWVDFKIDSSKQYLLVIDVIDDPSQDDTVVASTGGDGFYEQFSTTSYNTAAMPAGYIERTGKTICVSDMEVETKQTLGTDIIAEMSRDGGSTWDDVTMTRTSTNVGDTSNNILAGNVTFAATAGTNMVGRIRTVNKDKITVQGISVNWS